ncbi:MAG: class I SAM-dependent methyltransferase [Bryobacteraceae bacterium]|jgi:SAM-dependent methyltransferase
MSQDATKVPSRDTFASEYHRIRLPFDPERGKVWRAISRYLARWVDPDAGLLDLGAGYGDFSSFSAAREKWALDMNLELIGHWEENVRPLIQSALDPLPLASDSLGTVFASNFFEHFTKEEGARILLELRRVLKPGGRLIIVQPNFRLEPRRYFDDYTHKTIYTDAGFCGLLNASRFNLVHCEPRFTPFTMKSHWPKAEWMVDLYLRLPFRPFAGQFLVVAEPAGMSEA